MSCTRIALLLSIVLLTAGPHPASAGFETIEWTISDADMVVVGLLERPTRPGIGRVRVTETIKGIPAESLTFIYATNVQEHRVSACAAPMLLSVKTWKRHFGTDPVPGVPGCVLIPTDCNTSAITLDGSPPQPRSHPFLGSSSPEELLRRARLAARASSDGPAKPFPAQTILADKNGWLLDDLYVLLPANESALEVLGSWARSDQVHARHHAAWLIGVLGHPEGIPHLLRLLDDPFVDPGGWDQFSTNLGWGRWRVTQYPIRRAAWDSLQKLGYVGPAPLIRQPVLARRALPIWMLSLPAMPIVIGLLVAALVRTRRTSTGISAASLVLMMLFALLWVRSCRTTDDLAWDAQGRVREFWSHEGGLYYLETSVFNLNRPLSWGQFDGRGPLRPMWKLTGRAEPGSFWGFEHRADYKGASWGIVGTTRGRRVPHWAAVGLFAIPPLLWLRAVYAACGAPLERSAGLLHQVRLRPPRHPRSVAPSVEPRGAAARLLDVTPPSRRLMINPVTHLTVSKRSQPSMPGLLGRDERGGDWQDSAFLSLRVFADDGRVLHCRLMPGLTIGSDEACTFHVPGEGVLPVHATVEDEGAVFSIRCKDGASLVLPDGTWMEYLRLCDGVRFKVGRADVHCSRWAYDAQPPPRKAEPMEPPAPAQASAEPIKVLCDRCGADLAKLPEPARFCPRCGRAREPFAAASVPVRGPMGECLSQDPTP